MKNIKKNCFFVVGCLIGGVLGAVMAMRTDTLPELLMAFVLLFAAVYAQLILHEAGHLIAGLLTGYRFKSFRIGSLMLMKTRDRWRLVRYKLAGTGGQCLMAPPPMENGNYPNTLYHFGGAIMNLLWAVLAGLMLYLTGYSAWWLGTLAAGLIMAATNGIPMKTGMVDNDGRNAVRSLHEEDVRTGFYRQLQVNAALTDGRRLRDMPEEWFSCAEGQEHERGYLRFQYLLDRGDYEGAREFGERMKDCGMPGVHSALLENDLRCLDLLNGRVPSDPSKALRQLTKAMPSYPAVLRSNYLFALLQENDAEKAEQIKRKFEKMLRAYPYPSDTKADEALMALGQQKYADSKR